MLHTLVVNPLMRFMALASLATLPDEISHDVEEGMQSISRDMKMFTMNPIIPHNLLNPANPLNPVNPLNPFNTNNPMKNINEGVMDIFDEPVSLPQFDKMLIVSRKLAIKHGRDHYRYTYKATLPEVPTLAHDPPGSIFLPATEQPSFKWMKEVSKKFVEILGDTAKSMVTEFLEGNYHKLIDLFKRLDMCEYDQRPNDLSDYFNMFNKKPQSAYDFDMDEAFARWRLAGPNPMSIQPCTQDILNTKANIESLPDEDRQNILRAFKEGRLFVVDYSILGDLPSGQNKDKKHRIFQKYNVAPLALFEMPSDKATRNREWLKVMAIQCDRIETQNPKPPMFTPKDGMKWRMAKAYFNSADVDIGEALMHLAQTHRTVIPFMIAMHRQMSPRHPIYRLLRAHFEGTAFINWSADATFIKEGQALDHLINPNIKELDKFLGQKILETLSRDFSFPAMLKSRGMDNTTFPAPYPYRDDGQLLWDAISTWVDAYLRVYYGDDERTQHDRIENDNELQEWIKELRSDKGGRVKWLDSFENNRFPMLVKVVATVVFTASAQHAVVDFPLEDMGCYTPAFPHAVYKPPPKTRDVQVTSQDYLDMLPPIQMAETQKQITLLLGGVRYSTLGDYNSFAPDYFKDPKVFKPLARFQETLENINDIITMRNRDRMEPWIEIVGKKIAQNWAYPYMMPKNIPQSVYI